MTKEFLHLMEIYHLYFCNTLHNNKGCRFYLEKEQDECYTLPDHLAWKERTDKLITALECPNTLKATDKFKDIVRIVSELKAMTPETGMAVHLVKGLIEGL